MTLALLCAAPVAGCGSGNEPDADGGLIEIGLSDAVRPPDFPSDNDGAATSDNIGAPCDVETGQGCEGETRCLSVGAGVGVCVLPGCELDDPATPLSEDSCPAVKLASGEELESICTMVPIAAKDGGFSTINFCLPRCTPLPDSNPCAVIHPGLACDPLSILLNSRSEVCVLPACKQDLDCGTKDPFRLDSSCDKQTGVCLSRGKDDGQVGGPCKTSADCGPAQFCYPEQTSSTGQVVLEGGYCTVVGCKYGGPWSCPAGSKCFGLGSAGALSLCLAVGCSADAPPAADGCRDEASPGQYDCFYQGKDQVCWIDVSSN